ncbi:MAG: hypothetical protein ACRC6A_11465 [Fusobacteriaceae bacterium]
MIKKIKELFKKEIKENVFENHYTYIPSNITKKIAYEEYSKNQTICLKCFTTKYGYNGIIAILEYNSLNNINTSKEILEVLEAEILKTKYKLPIKNIIQKID